MILREDYRSVSISMVIILSFYHVGPVHTEARLGRNNTLTRSFDELQIFRFPTTSELVDIGDDGMLDTRKVKLEELQNNSILAITDAKSLFVLWIYYL